MSRIPPPKEPNGCLQTIVISRMIAQILFVPMLLILGGIICVAAALYAFAVHALLGIGVIVLTVLLLTALARWEYIRAKRGLPPPDDFDPIDPRMR